MVLPRSRYPAFLILASVFFIPAARADETFPGSAAPVVDLATDPSGGGNLHVATSKTVWIREGRAANWRSLPAPPFRIFGLEVVNSAPEPKAPWLLVVGGSPGRFGAVARFDQATGQWQDRKLGTDVFYDLSVNSRTGQVALAGADQEIWLLDSVAKLAGSPLRKIHSHSATVRAVTFSPDGSHLASGGLDGLILLSRASDRYQSPRILQEHTAGVSCLCWSPRSRQLASGSRDGKVRLHQADGRWLRTYSGFGREGEDSSPFDSPIRVTSLAWTRDGSHALAGSNRGGLYELDGSKDSWRPLAPPTTDEPVAAVKVTGPNLVLARGNRLVTLDRNAAD